MLNPNQLFKNLNLAKTIFFMALLSLYSCMPSSTKPRVDANSSTGPGTGGGSTVTNPSYQEPTFPLAGTFIQEGATRSSTNISMPVDFNDSFLVRGDVLSKYLRTLPTTTKFCIVGKFNYIPGTNKFLILSAKPKAFTDLINKTTEFYLQVEPFNDASNQNDCLNYNLTNALFDGVSSPSAYFSFSQLCTDCTTSVTSSGLRLYFINGQEVPTVPVSSLIVTIAGSTTSSGNSCSESTACKARGFDCCLQNQCVKDAALRPGAINLPGFESAQEDVRLNPNRFQLYPQFYFVCDSRPDGSTGGTGGGGQSEDPDYDASIRLLEMKQLADCLNKVDGEFSHCTLKFTQANESIPGSFSAAASLYYDDINFSTVNPTLGTAQYSNNIQKIVYAGQTLYEQGKTPLTVGTFTAANDNLTASQSVHLTAPLPPNARDANLYITYKVDGTCERVNATMAKCTKSYIHGSSDNTSTMWHDSTQIYRLPSYADTSTNASLIVKISETVIPEGSLTWSKAESPPRVVFSPSYTLYQNQKIEIQYFVNSNAAQLIKMRTDAQTQVNSMCTCASGSKCNLEPIMNTENTAVVNYKCTYPTGNSDEPPANQTVYVSNKNIAHRYFDTNGVLYDENYGNALDQEGSAFSYASNNILKPNNVDQYIGFNEIYGSFAKSGTYIARPAKMVRVKRNQFYDLLTNSGVFSSCLTCGSDYYTSLQKIFPQHFGGQGGGYAPDNYESRRENNSSLYRADDLLYGRACFVPATMIPWTHNAASTPRDQRRSRLAAQHFLFANGYNRDWYGFDYGSLIGSFDGVTWFSIGNQRRIKATSSKLYLAINTYLGDLSVDSNFNVTVSESTAYSSAIPEHDLESDGAQCQKSHICSNDNDCYSQLGYDYTCQNVATVTTNWPQFDPSGSEVVGSSSRSLVSIVGGSNGSPKRCMYRGKGAPCLSNLSLAGSVSTFNGSTSVGTLMCSPNSSCVPLNTTNRFNDSIARFANTPLAQNLAEASPTLSDTVGQGARIILRPFDFYGNKSVPPLAQSALNIHGVSAICIPGKEVTTASTTYNLDAGHPNNRIDSSDKLFGVGTTSASAQSLNALNACPAIDQNKINVHTIFQSLGTPNINAFSISQNLSSNLLDLSPLVGQNIFSSTAGSQITSIGYQRNACLRAPGSSCFTDMECAPSGFVAAKAKASNLSTVMNEAEAKYWEEDLVCGNPSFKYIASGVKNPDFDIKKNVCCREFGKAFTVYTEKNNTSPYKWCNSSNEVQVAGVNTSISNNSRYSRVHTAYDKMTCNRAELGTKSFALSLTAPGRIERMEQILNQFKTLDTINERTCCTKNWVRSFSTENGGGHVFSKAKLQNIDKFIWRNISWAPDDETTILLPPGGVPVGDAPFECHFEQYMNASCEIKTMMPADDEKYLTWAGSLELVGIPQVAIMANDQVHKLVTNNQSAIAAGTAPPLSDKNGKTMLIDVPLTMLPLIADFQDSKGMYYSASSYDKLNMDVAGVKNTMKKVFSENEFNCCVPSGGEVPDSVTPSQCCTGSIANINGPRRCCLPDFTDITLYLNRYVSSEGRGLPDSAYDPRTGYIKDVGQVKLIAAQKNLCCSGKVMTGVAISQLPIPLTGGTFLPPDASTTVRRFNYRDDGMDNVDNVGPTFDRGVRWNNHVYCVP